MKLIFRILIASIYILSFSAQAVSFNCSCSDKKDENVIKYNFYTEGDCEGVGDKDPNAGYILSPTFSGDAKCKLGGVSMKCHYLLEKIHPYYCTKINTDNTAKQDKYPTNPKIYGRVIIDYAHFHESRTPLGNHVDLRSGRLGVEGSVSELWGYRFSVDFDKNELDVKDAYLSYTGFKPIRIRIGQFKEPFSLEYLTSFNYITFMERGLPDAFVPGRKIGIGADTDGPLFQSSHYTAAIGVFSDAIGHKVHIDDHEGDEGGAVTGRLTYAYVPEKDKVIHLGIAASHHVMDSNHLFSVDSTPETAMTDVKFVDTGDIPFVHAENLWGLEAAGVYKALSIQTEFMDSHVDRSSNPGLNFKGWYVFGSWFLTGESRNYEVDKAVFGMIKPLHSYGAWEIAARYSHLNLNSDSILGGKEQDATLGLNWYVNSYVRFMANLIKVRADKAGLINTPTIFMLRAQVTF